MEHDSGSANSAGHDSSGTNLEGQNTAAMQLIAFEGDKETGPGAPPYLGELCIPM